MPTKVLVDTDSVQTLTNKTFTAASFSGTGVVLSTPTIINPVFSGTSTGTLTIGGAVEGSAINVLATGSTTTRNLATREADWVNALDNGVVADGVTDNTPAIIALPNVPIYFPPGTYVISTDANETGLQNNKFFSFGGVKLTEGGANRTQTQTAYGFGALANDTGWDSTNPSLTGKNTAFGTRALTDNSNGYHNTAVGFEALRQTTTGQQNTAIGMSALEANITGRDNVAVGTSALLSCTGSFNTAVGRAAGLAVTSGTQNTLLGRDAGNNLTTGDNNTFLGDDTGHSLTDTDISDTVLIGRGAGYFATGDQAVVIGNLAGGGTTANVIQSVLIGYNAGNLIEAAATRTVAVGYRTLDALTTGARNVAVGNEALGDLVTGAGNIAVGYNAGAHVVGAANIAIGDQAMSGASNAGDNNLALGQLAGNAITSGNQNVFIGVSSGSTTTTGSSNTLIGYDVDAVAAGTANQLTVKAGTSTIKIDDAIAAYSQTNTTDGVALIPARQQFRLTADGSAITTVANYFGATSNISLVASAYYHIDIYLYFLKTTTEALTITLLNSAAPTSQNIFWEQSPATGIVAPPGTATLLSGHFSKDATASRTIATAALTTAVDHYIHIKIELQNGTGTSLKIQATNPAGSITPRVNSYWTSTRIPTGNTGTFAA